jgi:putative transposase
MARQARIVVPGEAHHVTQRGNRNMQVFFNADDSAAYKTLLAAHCKEAEVEVLAWCLMPNHVHLVLVPNDEDGLRRALGETHRRYTKHINAREGWRGHLWQERFHSFAMDEAHLLEAVRYIELNPVRAGLAKKAHDWRWSSARAHLEGCKDGLVSLQPMFNRVDNWQSYLDEENSEENIKNLHQHSRTGRPLGNAKFIGKLEAMLGRKLAAGQRGRPKKNEKVKTVPE